MGVYDQQVGPFVDLRETGHVTKKRKKVGKHGLEPKFVEQVEQVVQHILTERKKILGAAARPRVGATWRTSVQNLLRGTTASQTVFTADQLCDIFDFAAQDPFWRAHVQDPSGLVKHAHKLWAKSEYAVWSVANGRPEANRPEQGNTQTKVFKGQLAADKPGVPSGWGGAI